jgi:exodeoxyribonuclease-3
MDCEPGCAEAHWIQSATSSLTCFAWRLDYFLVSEPLVARVRDVVIHDHLAGSDHCPVELILASGGRKRRDH